MAFSSWCLCHAFDARQRFNTLEQRILRRRLAADAKAYRAALMASWVSQLSTGILRDIQEGRVEA